MPKGRQGQRPWDIDPVWKAGIRGAEADNREDAENEFIACCRFWYVKGGLARPWNCKRLMLACNLVGLRPTELGAMVGIHASEMRMFMKRDWIPIPLCLLFKMIEQWYRETVLGVNQPELYVPLHFIGRKELLQRMMKQADKYDDKNSRPEFHCRVFADKDELVPEAGTSVPDLNFSGRFRNLRNPRVEREVVP